MRSRLATAVAVMLLVSWGGLAAASDLNLFAAPAPGEQPAAQPFDLGSCCDPCSSDACCRPRLLVEAEATLFRYYRANGVRVGDDAPGDDVRFGWEGAPRFTLGYVTASGLGFRTRYWDFNQTAAAKEGLPSRLTVDTYTLDLELFESFALNNRWSVEFSAGVRYNDFQEKFFDVVGDTELRHNTFFGWGGILGVEVKRQLFCNGALFGRCRGALLMDDSLRSNIGSGNERLLDTTRGVVELAMGYEYRRCLSNGAEVYGRIGAEWQHWVNYSSNFTEGTTDPERFWTGSSDVGFMGMVVSLGLSY